MKITPIELGCAGHLIVATHCRWKRHTQVGLYRVSSIGDYYPPVRSGEKPQRDTIGAGDKAFFETMVFRTTETPEADSEDCGCLQVESWSELAATRYATAGEAQAGHERYVKKYLARAHREGRPLKRAAYERSLDGGKR